MPVIKLPYTKEGRAWAKKFKKQWKNRKRKTYKKRNRR